MSIFEASVGAERAVLFHDLRSPLAAIQGHTQLLRRKLAGAPPDERQLTAYLGQVEGAATRIARLLDELYDLDQGLAVETARAHRANVDLVALAQRMAASALEPGGLARVTVMPALPRLMGRWDEAGLERMFANLFGNALKYSPADTPIVATITAEDERAVIRVSDRGIGIPAADLPHIFEPYYRAGNAAAQNSGTGLGLAGVWRTVDEHAGTIDIDSAEGLGTTVTVCLPLAPAG
jgi:signal transduction histidine kinase